MSVATAGPHPTYLYGVVPAGTTLEQTVGVEGAPIRTIEHDGIAAIVSEVRQSWLQFARGERRTHSLVLASALEHGSVLPMRFGLVMEDTAAVQELLDTHQDELREHLQGLAGRVEFRLRAVYEDGVAESCTADAWQILETLERFAVAVAPANPLHDRMVLNAAFLVGNDDVETFAAVVDQAGHQQVGRMRLKRNGPLPPHSFVDLRMEA